MYKVAFLRACEKYSFLVDKLKEVENFEVTIVDFKYDQLSEFSVYDYDLLIISINYGVLSDVEIFLNNIMLFYSGVIMVLDESFSLQRKFIFSQLEVDNYFYMPLIVKDFINYLPWYLNQNKKDEILKYKDLVLNLNDRTLRRNDTVLSLKNMEFRLLKYLLVNKGKILSKSRILEEVWDMNSIINSKTVEVHMCRLRKKIDLEYEEKLLHTIPNTGYMLK